jgi:two-component system phosphate regulon sensor histidine kinase PhoR
MNRKIFSILLVVLSIAVIAAFQIFWLRNNYAEQMRLFTIHGNILFRETIFKLQASKLHLDTNIHINIRHADERGGLISMTQVLRDEIKDSSKKTNAFIVSINTEKKTLPADSPVRYFLPDRPLNDSAVKMIRSTERVGPAGPQKAVYDFLLGVDSLQDSISIKELQQRYNDVLKKEGINTAFHILVSKADSTQATAAPDLTDNRVTLGFSKPVNYDLYFDRPAFFVLKKLAPQFIFSFLLLGLTVFSFWVLYQNWQKQQNLTQLKNEFISNITHELKTPIATVSVAIEALKNFNALQDPQKTREYLDISGHELQRLSLLVDKVLKLSMFEKEQIEIRNEPFDLKELVQEILSSMRLQLQNYQAQVSVEQEGNDFTIHADKLHFSSVLFNLLDNALKYSKGIPSIQVRLHALQDQVLLSMTDNGIGIAPEYQQKIFDKFFRTPSGNKHNVKGYGLGLSYVAYVIKSAGGTIEVDSKEGIGTRFTIKLPRRHGQD